MPDILKVVDIHTSPQDVFETVATAAGIRRWWSGDVEGDDDVGSQVTIRFGENWKVVMKRIEATRDQRVAYQIIEHDSDEWIGTTLAFELTPEDDWTTLKFDHRDWSAETDFFRFCSTKWTVFLLSIKRASETGIGTPYPNEPKIGKRD